VNRPPDFDELMEGVEHPEERERLRRVHELLLAAGPPPELSPDLALVPKPEQKPAPTRRTRRRLALGGALAAALVVATFGIGYLAGNDDSEESAMPVNRTIALTGSSGASATVDLGFKGADGNWPMIVTVRGLRPLQGGDYYTLSLTREGKPIVTCGTFNVGSGETRFQLTAAYDLKRFDGWIVTLWDAQTHEEKPVLRTARV
jgi:hypothetical protein